MLIAKRMLILLAATLLISACCPNEEDGVRIQGQNFYSTRGGKYHIIHQFDDGRIKILAPKNGDYVSDPVVVSLGKKSSFVAYPISGIQSRLHVAFLKPTDKEAYLLLSTNFEPGSSYTTCLLSIELRRNTSEGEWVKISRNMICLAGHRQWEVAFEKSNDSERGCYLIAVPEGAFQSDGMYPRKRIGVINLVESFERRLMLDYYLYTPKEGFWPD